MLQQHILALLSYGTLVSSTATTLQHVDVVIVGAGLSGLATAKGLAEANKTFAVLEARDRVGGRVLDINVTEYNIQEVGAEFVGPTQDRVIALAKSLGLEMYPTYNDGNHTIHLNNRSVNYNASSTGGLPPLGTEVLTQVAQLITQIDQWASELNVSAPWEHPNASRWDSTTFRAYAEQEITEPEALFLLETATTSIFSATMSELSLLYAISYIASAGNETSPGTLERLIGTRGGAQDSRINGGTQLLAIKLAAKLGLQNIHFNAPVRRITCKGKGYLVEADGLSISATKVVVAMSPPMAGRIIYDPLLPAGRDQLTQRMPMGAIGKAIAMYSTPWWRETGINAQAISDSGIIRSTFDNTPPNKEYGAIMGFIEADNMRKLDDLPEGEVKDLVAETFANIFGPRARNFTSILIQRWDLEEFSRGGPTANAGPGLLTQYGPHLSKPYEGIHFAGTETADYWKGYMDGAIRSGERVAREVLDTL